MGCLNLQHNWRNDALLAQLNVLIDDRKTASLYAKQAQSLLPGDAPEHLAMGNYLAVADLWKSIGDQEEHKRG